MVIVYNLPRLLGGTVQYDGVDVHYAAQRYLSDELHAGRLPFWTPYVFSGFPFLADVQVAAWYPLNWPFFLIGITPTSIGAELALHQVIATLGAYALGVRLVGARAPAAATGVFYGLSGWFAAHSQHVGMVETAAWLPWLVLLLTRIAEHVTWPRISLAALLGAAVILPGHFQLALYTFFFVGVWAILESASHRSWSVFARFAMGLAAAGVWGAALAAVALLPALELVLQSVRTVLNALQLPDVGYFHVGSLITLAYPNYYGLLSGPYTGPGDSTQHYFYAGFPFLPLVVLGARQWRTTRLALFLGVPFVWYALGPSGGLYRVLARLPGFSSVELPMHGWFLVSLGLALLAGAGASRLGKRWASVVVLFTLVDVTIVNQLLNPLAYAHQSFDQLYGSALRDFAAQVAASPAPVERVYGPPLTAIGYRNHALQNRVQTTYGYNPLELARYAAYAEAAEANPKLVNGFAASHAVIDGRLEVNSDALPLAYFARRISMVADDAAARDALAALGPAQSTLVIGPPPDNAQWDPDSVASVIARGEDEVVLHYRSSTPNVLRVAIPSYPGWRASLGDTELPLVPVDYAFTGVVVPPGEGDIRLMYAPRLFLPSVAISILALGALCADPARKRLASAGAGPRHRSLSSRTSSSPSE